MDIGPSNPDSTEKPIPVPHRRRVGVFILGGLIGLGLGVVGGIAAGIIGYLIGYVLYPSLGLGLFSLLLGPMMVFPIAGLCTGLVTATQRSIQRGAVVGAVIFGGSYLVLSIPSITEFWMAVASLVMIAAVLGALIGAVCAALSLGWSTQKSATLQAGK